jgi:hypothetical protein
VDAVLEGGEMSEPILPPALLEALKAYVEARIELAMAVNEVGADGYGVSTVDEQQKAESTWQAVLATNEVKP